MQSRKHMRDHARKAKRQTPTTKPSPLIVSKEIFPKYQRTASGTPNGNYPHLTNAQGGWEWQGADWWTAGFYPGTLYALHERSTLCPSSTDVDFLALARKWSDGLVGLSYGNTQGHDQGFMAIPFAEELKVNPDNKDAKATLQRYADILAVRYSNVVGVTKSWDRPDPNFMVIMDNMMNLDLLYKAAELGSPASYRDIAQSHAKTTSYHHLRDDGSSFHVVNYDSNNGGVSSRFTAQGYADWSTWARGQTWGIHGFVTMHQLTGDGYFLDVSKKMGHLFLNRLASSPGTVDGVPPWDFDAPAPTSSDTSAAAIAATGFLHIAEAEGDSEDGNWWRSQAVKVLSDATDKYFASPEWDAILTNGTSNRPIGAQDTGIVYGDYYWVKAGNMLLQQGLISCDGTTPTSSTSSSTSSSGTSTPTTTRPVDVKFAEPLSAGYLSAEPMLAVPWMGVAALFVVAKSMFGF